MTFWEKIFDDVAEGIGNAVDTIADAIVEIWQAIKTFAKWFFDKVFQFGLRVREFFLGLKGENKIKNQQEAVIIRLEEILKSEDRNEIDIGLTKPTIMATLMDKNTGEIDLKNTQIVEYERLDEETKRAFGNKNVVVLK